MEISKKSEIRAEIRTIRKELDPDWERAANAALRTRLLAETQIRRSEMVYCYLDYGREADTRQILSALWASGIRTAVPRVEGKELFFYRIRSMEDVVPGYRGIMEPGPECPRCTDRMAPVIVPGVAFDREGNRLGYGGGYYDRFFAREPQHQAIGIGFSFQIRDGWEPQPHDRPMDLVVTETAVYGGRERK